MDTTKTYPANQAWRESLKPGDEFYDAGGAWQSPTIGTVARVTPTQVVDTLGTRFKKEGGCEIGTGSRRRWLMPLTPELREKCEFAALCKWLGGIKPQNLTLPHLRAMYRAHEEIELNK